MALKIGGEARPRVKEAKTPQACEGVGVCEGVTACTAEGKAALRRELLPAREKIPARADTERCPLEPGPGNG
jgi:hypothetical protein